MKNKGFIKTTTGTYKVRGEIKEEDIISYASNLLYKDLQSKTKLSSSKESGHFLQLKLGGSKNERFAVIFLTAQHSMIAYEELFQGTVDSASIYPRIVVQRALELNASSLILSHCHPSACHEQSSDADREITKRIVEACSLVDLKVLDHFIVSSNGYMSMAEKGEM